VSSYFPFPNSRLIPGFSTSLYPKIPKISLATCKSKLKLSASLRFGASPQKYSSGDIVCKLFKIKKKCFVFSLEKKAKTNLAIFLFQK